MKQSMLAVLGGAAVWSIAVAGSGCGVGNDIGDGGSGAGNSDGNGSGNGNGDQGAGTFATGDGAAQTGTGGGCAGTVKQAEKIPLDMYIMLDQSSSMGDAAGSGTKWTEVSGALDAFVAQPAAASLGIGIQYFGVPSGGGTCGTSCTVDADCGVCGPCFAPIPGFGFCLGAAGGDSCIASDYATPEVEIATNNGAAITASIAAHQPTTSTPTSAALQGAVDHAGAWAQAHPDHVVIALLASDGDPTECNTDLGSIDAIAAAAFAGTPSIRTFVIGIGSVDALNGIAAAGGTGMAFITDQGNTQMQFLDALNAIQGTALACSYLIPVPDNGTPDYGSVNVKYTPGDGSGPITIPNVADASQCPAVGNAWYYDDPTAPTQIILCDPTCNTVSADTTGSIEIVLGCATIPA